MTDNGTGAPRRRPVRSVTVRTPAADSAAACCPAPRPSTRTSSGIERRRPPAVSSAAEMRAQVGSRGRRPAPLSASPSNTAGCCRRRARGRGPTSPTRLAMSVRTASPRHGRQLVEHHRQHLRARRHRAARRGRPGAGRSRCRSRTTGAAGQRRPGCRRRRGVRLVGAAASACRPGRRARRRRRRRTACGAPAAGTVSPSVTPAATGGRPAEAGQPPGGVDRERDGAVPSAAGGDGDGHALRRPARCRAACRPVPTNGLSASSRSMTLRGVERPAARPATARRPAEPGGRILEQADRRDAIARLRRRVRAA